MKNWKKTLSVLLTATFLSSTAHAGAIDALKKFNQDADGLSGNFTQTVQSKKKNQTSSGTFQILRQAYSNGITKAHINKPLWVMAQIFGYMMLI